MLLVDLFESHDAWNCESQIACLIYFLSPDVNITDAQTCPVKVTYFAVLKLCPAKIFEKCANLCEVLASAECTTIN